MTRLRFTSSAALSLVLCLGCAPEAAPRSPDAPVEGRARLEVVGADAAQVDAGGELELAFRYLGADGATVAGASVALSVEGAPSGASLAARTSVTGDDGVATVTVRAGDAGRFEVTAEAGDATPASVRVEVRAMRYGALDYEARYAGSRDVRGLRAGLFVNASCEDVRRAVPAPHTAQSPRLGAPSAIEGLPLGVPMALYVLGLDGAGVVAAESCTDVALDADRADVTASLVDTALGLAGPYATVETFDVTGGFSNELNTILEVSAGLSSDAPARWLVDEVAESPRAPGWVRSALGSGFTRSLVADLLQTELDRIHTPREVAEMGRFGADVDAAFRALTFEGELHFDAPDEFAVSMGTHQLSAMQVTLSDGEVYRRPLALSAETVVTFGERIDVDEHAFALPFGELVDTILYYAVLARMSGGHHTVDELLGDYVDCDAVAARLGTGTTGTLARTACEVGVSMMQSRLRTALSNLYAFETLNLSGSAGLVDADGDYDLETLDAGEAHARWTGASGELAFAGVFDGHALADAPATHPVLARLAGLE